MAEHTYRCVAVNADAFLAQLVRYIQGGHYFYVTGRHPDPDGEKNKRRVTPKSLEQCDKNLTEKFRISMPRWERSRRRLAGQASVQYLRYGRFFVLMATHGEHKFFDEHRSATAGKPDQYKDVRKVAIRFDGYSVRYTFCAKDKKFHTLVRLEPRTYARLKAHFLVQALRESKEELEQDFRRIYFQSYGPLIQQLYAILRVVNRKRKAAGLTALNYRCVRTRLRLTKVFVQAPSVQIHSIGSVLFQGCPCLLWSLGFEV